MDAQPPDPHKQGWRDILFILAVTLLNARSIGTLFLGLLLLVLGVTVLGIAFVCQFIVVRFVALIVWLYTVLLSWFWKK